MPYSEGARVYLREVQVSDLPHVLKWKADPVVRRMALYPGVEVTPENQEEDITRAREAHDQLYVIVVVKETNTPIGYIRGNMWGGQPGNIWLRFALGEERGKGYGKDALRCLITQLFREGFHRIDAEVYAFNIPCQKLLTSLGFVREGVKRKAFFRGEGEDRTEAEKYVDILVFGLLERDFRD